MGWLPSQWVNVMMLRQVLQELESTTGPVDLNALSRKLGVERSALDGMVAFWVRKGRLQDDYATALADRCAGGDCAASCREADSCPLLTKLPRSFSLVDPDR
jgi:hypothetical protein